MPQLKGKAPRPKRAKVKYHPSHLPRIIQAIYSYYDCDNSDYLKKTQFAMVLSKLVRDMGGEKPSMEEIEDILYEIDINGDGQVSKQQFHILMEKVIEVMGQNAHQARFMGHQS